ncbi:hypothetical protein [Desulfoscipio geothermicus]|uniref:Uncharacterized protein n=1 Tax=Desulfoscipio geothermicus DSM 3669 TaxID=1121426 RepID=A0A1I6E210_9FIRM|nr:hypothetical protein [Desulfoscipio geothermicus]SFR11736.1 hypothetical protein SAMN05660706_12353 [Desulfoscipio geothermicus DSM 3669]
MVGRRVIFWRATRSFKGPHPWSGKETETWEWEREKDSRGMLWEAVTILLMVIIPGLLPMFFYNSIFPPSFHFSVWYWLITSVMASFFVLGKKYAEEWYNLVIPRWSVRWYFREKGR